MRATNGEHWGRSIQRKRAATNTLGMDKAELQRFLSNRAPGSDRIAREGVEREHRRWAYPVTTVDVEFLHPGGSSTKVTLACKNLSSSGIALLHRSFVHMGTRCTLSLPDVKGSILQVRGIVVRCRHVEGPVHEIGVHFDTEA